MSLLQYMFDFHHSCSKHSNINEIRKLLDNKELRSAIVSENFKEVKEIKIIFM